MKYGLFCGGNMIFLISKELINGKVIWFEIRIDCVRCVRVLMWFII